MYDAGSALGELRIYELLGGQPLRIAGDNTTESRREQIPLTSARYNMG